jgi:hypothetical protein
MLDSEEDFQFLKANITLQMLDIQIVDLFLHHIEALDIISKSNTMLARNLLRKKSYSTSVIQAFVM